LNDRDYISSNRIYPKSFGLGTQFKKRFYIRYLELENPMGADFYFGLALILFAFFLCYWFRNEK